MRGFLRLIFQLIIAALIIFVLTGLWIICDGLSDLGEHADVALVCAPGNQQENKSLMETRLNRAIELYNDNEFPCMVVSGVTERGHSDEAATMARYLETHGIPAKGIIEDHRGDNTQDTARNLAEIMKQRHFHSVMIVTDYFHITRTKLALRHEGISDIQKAHVGKLQQTDAFPIAREVVAFYVYLGRFYLLPEAEKAREEAKVGEEKIKTEAEKAKEKVDKSLNSMAK